MKFRKEILIILVDIMLTAAILAACSLAQPATDNGRQKTTDKVQTTTPLPVSPLPSSPALSSPTSFSPALSSPSPLPSASLSPTPSTPDLPVHSHTQYALTAHFNYTAHTLSVSETVTYTNATTATLIDLLFIVEPNLFPGSFRLDTAYWQEGKPVEPYTLEGDRLRIPLPQPLPPGRSTGLTLGYELTLPPIPPPEDNTKPQPFGYTARQTNVVDWYPFLPPYRPGQGWLAHDPWFYGEYLVYDVGDYRVDIQRTDPAPELTIAASAPAERSGELYRYRFDAGRSFAISASPEYRVYSETVGTTTVLSYVFPLTPEAGQATLWYTADALVLYNDLFGAYPHASLSVVEADFLDGMEYEGLFFLSNGFYNLYDGSPRGYLTAIAAHETAHQWWYGLVGNDQALEPWLDEGLCTYSERLFYEHYYPDLVDWWWSFRVNFYHPTGHVNSPIYNYNGFRPYRDAVYLRGALFLENLRKEIGDEAFFAFLKDYAARGAHRQATTKDFFAILAKHTTVDISGLVKEYFEVIK